MAEEEKTGKEQGGGLCRPHFADSKYPCVNMEKTMRGPTREKPKREKT